MSAEPNEIEVTVEVTQEDEEVTKETEQEKEIETTPEQASPDAEKEEKPEPEADVEVVVEDPETEGKDEEKDEVEEEPKKEKEQDEVEDEPKKQEKEEEEDEIVPEEETHAEDGKILKAKQDLEAAKEKYAEANQEVVDNVNEFAQDAQGLKPELLKQARQAQIKYSPKWYEFWQTTTILPKDNKYEVPSGEKKEWKVIVKENEELLRQLTAEEDVEGITWEKSGSKRGVVISTSPEISKAEGIPHKGKMYKLETPMNLAPKSVLLGVLRGPVLGRSDPNLIYFREHCNFPGGNISLVHKIRKISSNGSVSIRDFVELTSWSEDEDGTIYFTAISVNALKEKIPDVIRGITIFEGFKISPSENGGSDVTYVSQKSMKGWVLGMFLDWVLPGNLTSYVKSIEEAVHLVQEEENEEKFVKKFVLREL